MDSFRGLSPLQIDVLREFFTREQRFVLTGGGALVGFHLQHRSSDDLDLFTKPPVVQIGAQAQLPGVTPLELDTFRADLVQQLRRLGLPPS